MKGSRWTCALLVLLASAGCDKPAGPQPAPEPIALTSSSAVASAAASAPEPAPDPSSAKKWTGTYEAKRATLETPPKVTDFTWKNDDGSKALGTGQISMTITEGVVGGDATGPLGPQKLAGMLDGTILRLELVPSDPTSPSAMAGSGVGELKDGAISGTLRVSGPKGVEVREVSFTLKPST
jgi:surface antigen